MRIDALDSFAVEHCLQTEHTVGSWVLRTNVNHIVIGTEQTVLLALQVAILVNEIFQTVIGFYIILQRIFVVELPVLAEGIALEIATEEEATHIGMTEEHDAVEVVNFTLQQVGNLPNVRNGRQIRSLLLCLGNLLHAATLVGLGILQDVDTSESLFWTEVLTDDGYKIIEALLVLQVLHLLCELFKIE